MFVFDPWPVSSTECRVATVKFSTLWVAALMGTYSWKSKTNGKNKAQSCAATSSNIFKQDGWERKHVIDFPQTGTNPKHTKVAKVHSCSSSISLPKNKPSFKPARAWLVRPPTTNRPKCQNQALFARCDHRRQSTKLSQQICKSLKLTAFAKF